ncbi:MAG: Holliday junction branch migration protein RuvA [Burkholderiales bacterium]|nr:Holliday junction branch migration protein RuvA [Burkholderiales bacterium]
MIGLLVGKLLEITPPQITILVNGVGYEVDMPISHIANLPSTNQEITIYTNLVIREDAHTLYGFNKKSERDCFRQLIKVSGIGPKIALALLSTMDSNELQHAIDSGDIDVLCRTPGIGKKMAERMLLELKGKALSNVEFEVNTGLFKDDKLNSNLIKNDIQNALESLGYNSKEITVVIKQIPEGSDLAQSIKEALKLLSKH